MSKLLSKIFPCTRIKKLEKENKELYEKLSQRQEVINKTNAYWKKRFNDLLRRNRTSNL